MKSFGTLAFDNEHEKNYFCEIIINYNKKTHDNKNSTHTF